MPFEVAIDQIAHCPPGGYAAYAYWKVTKANNDWTVPKSNRKLIGECCENGKISSIHERAKSKQHPRLSVKKNLECSKWIRSFLSGCRLFQTTSNWIPSMLNISQKRHVPPGAGNAAITNNRTACLG
ncbi:hypothetical protein H0G86_013273 [Trichoderma simmonsii]|uniref:Uncharacterized protein n=1 Tax=Trichoderma simmonsii TaxID=1491479 RepID=A0A8G0LSZ3_9HYPO|nr:hypothetical protein H0G86_013273 [Trichoderma simmonsii]